MKIIKWGVCKKRFQYYGHFLEKKSNTTWTWSESGLSEVILRR
jgi:hypothetical protein